VLVRRDEVLPRIGGCSAGLRRAGPIPRRADDYYLAEDSGVASRYVASPLTGVRRAGSLTGEAYERWVAGFDAETGAPKGRLRSDRARCGSSRSWSTDRRAGHSRSRCIRRSPTHSLRPRPAAEQIIGWVSEHATTRVSPKGRQVQVPVTEMRWSSLVSS
jgi:exodeoxyribonuclease V alpha subunit